MDALRPMTARDKRLLLQARLNSPEFLRRLKLWTLSREPVQKSGRITLLTPNQPPLLPPSSHPTLPPSAPRSQLPHPLGRTWDALQSCVHPISNSRGHEPRQPG